MCITSYKQHISVPEKDTRVCIYSWQDDLAILSTSEGRLLVVSMCWLVYSPPNLGRGLASLEVNLDDPFNTTCRNAIILCSTHILPYVRAELAYAVSNM